MTKSSGMPNSSTRPNTDVSQGPREDCARSRDGTAPGRGSPLDPPHESPGTSGPLGGLRRHCSTHALVAPLRMALVRSRALRLAGAWGRWPSATAHRPSPLSQADSQSGADCTLPSHRCPLSRQLQAGTDRVGFPCVACMRVSAASRTVEPALRTAPGVARRPHDDGARRLSARHSARTRPGRTAPTDQGSALVRRHRCRLHGSRGDNPGPRNRAPTGKGDRRAPRHQRRRVARSPSPFLGHAGHTRGERPPTARLEERVRGGSLAAIDAPSSAPRRAPAAAPRAATVSSAPRVSTGASLTAANGTAGHHAHSSTRRMSPRVRVRIRSRRLVRSRMVSWPETPTTSA